MALLMSMPVVSSTVSMSESCKAVRSFEPNLVGHCMVTLVVLYTDTPLP